MTLAERVFQYCERGTNEALWAEPINAISNAGFFLAALIFWQLLLWRPKEERSPDHYLFVALVFAICIGSVMFHVYADRATELADIIPIGLFMLVYLGFALNRFLNVPPGWTVFLAAIFAGLVAASMQIHCWDGGIGFAGGAPDAKVCLNGSAGYLPALAALIVVGMLLAERRHKAAPYVLAATVIFAGSILLRSLDMSLCQRVVIEGRPVGTHFVWHLLNALVLFLLMRASLETGTWPLPAAEPAAASEAEESETPKTPEPAAKDAAPDAAETEAVEAEPKPAADSKPQSAPQEEASAGDEANDEPKDEAKGEPENGPKVAETAGTETSEAEKSASETPEAKTEAEPADKESGAKSPRKRAAKNKPT